jgi:hypothetical protein
MSVISDLEQWGYLPSRNSIKVILDCEIVSI